MFEKIFLTYLFVSIILACVALILANVWEFAWILAIPFILAIFFLLSYWLVKLGCFIWGYDICLFSMSTFLVFLY